MPLYQLPIGYQIMSLKADMNECCHVGGPFRHTVEYQLERLHHSDQRGYALFKLKQMAFFYTAYLMHQFPDLQRTISNATLAMHITETLIREESDNSLK